MASSRPGSSTRTAPRPAPRPTSPGNYGSPRKPRPTPGSNSPTPKLRVTRPDGQVRRRSPATWPPSASNSKPRTPAKETWTADTSGRREAGGRAKAELERRKLAQQTAGQRQAESEDGPQ